MTYTISKEFTFSASHTLRGLPEGHQCARIHGHNYVVRVEVTGDLDEVGFVVDYATLGGLGVVIDDRLDHRHLNDVLDINPTAELLSRHLTETAREVLDLPIGTTVQVWVSETPRTWAVWNG